MTYVEKLGQVGHNRGTLIIYQLREESEKCVGYDNSLLLLPTAILTGDLQPLQGWYLTVYSFSARGTLLENWCRKSHVDQFLADP